ncbi:uncharacterized protein DUF1460 [Dyadobacter jejuensis]|uniref:Uncharacterized protein DUF1460 n=1 Tax=Dyadobacter jejuensis TaxID=1082580 RepID=A0A316APT6_9BACT|nr:N-acetylmuramoyl-L-alanine amidase-like domain-containing protein [Dyadobacter jejuensis]PWJ59279.1 uncharacterized protein DUF1460 [Dyadobacter jejuensis]
MNRINYLTLPYAGRWSTLLSIFLLASTAVAQNEIQQQFEKKMDLPNTGDIGLEVLRMAESFLGVPYMAQTLETNKTERLVCKLDGLDCTTLVESTIALVVAKEQNKSLDDYKRELRNLRYRKGVIEGYASRLHYVLDWLYENENRGRLEDITERLGGVPFKKEINFMSNHANLYPALAPSEVWKKVKSQEAIINTRKHYYIPKNDIKRAEASLKNGDIVAFTSTIDGLDCNHMGLITKIGNRAYLLHASSTEKKVILSKVPLAEYTSSVPKHSGILVARLKEIIDNE